MGDIINIILVFVSVVCSESAMVEGTESPVATLTTARHFDDTSPMPSSFYRRINVERSEGVSSTPLDLFIPVPQRRSHVDSVWKWDFLCQLQPKTGNCSAVGQQQQVMRQSYHYDAQLDTCQTFIYSGCGGNKNNFATLVECERHCKGSTYMTLKETSKDIYCGLQPNAGLCLALIQRYYYDVNTNSCKMFVYGGCGGNQNRFKTESLCIERCGGYK